jgi:dTDP-4-amino-4,6-dideoxygalactose transaminase
MKVPFMDLRVQYESIKNEMDAAMQSVIHDSAFVMGKYVKAFEEKFAAFCGVSHCIGVGNGTDALYVALRSLGVGPGDEVITVANSFIATSEAVTLTGAKVVFTDCDPRTASMDVGKVRAAITPRTKALLPVHLYGLPADLDALMQLAKEHGLVVVEDAAQAHGGELNGRRVGSLGHAACFSFYPGKNLGAYGDGGAVVTSDQALAERVRMLANHGRLSKYDHEFEGVNSRLDGLQGAVLGVKLGHLEKWTEMRRRAAARYDANLRDSGVGVLEAPGNVRHVYHLYVVIAPGRDKVRQALADRGVSTGIHYPIPLPGLQAYRYLGHKSGDFPNAEGLAGSILSLPMFPEITDEQIDYVCACLREAVDQARTV